jgi:hypothetical protein
MIRRVQGANVRLEFTKECGARKCTVQTLPATWMLASAWNALSSAMQRERAPNTT